MESTEIQQHEIAEIEEFADKRDTMIGEIRKVIVGQDRVIEEVLIALFAKGHCLLVGVPGVVAMLDLGVFLPATVATCVGLVRGSDWAPKALYTVVGWFGLVGPAVAAMAITMYVNDDPLASGGSTLFMSVLGGAFLLLALFLYLPLLHTDSQARVGVTR